MSRIGEALVPDLFGYPFAPGAKTDGTSREAADAVKEGASAGREKVYEAIRDSNGLTADEVAAKIGRTPFYVRPRLSELRAAGRIEPTGERRKNDSGMSAMVWKVRA